jgi:hypothetical protein
MKELADFCKSQIPPEFSKTKEKHTNQKNKPQKIDFF